MNSGKEILPVGAPSLTAEQMDMEGNTFPRPAALHLAQGESASCRVTHTPNAPVPVHRGTQPGQVQSPALRGPSTSEPRLRTRH